jgi:REP element-mobilizing transposase RayT
MGTVIREAEKIAQEREEKLAREQQNRTLSAARMLEEKRGLRILPAEEFDANVAASVLGTEKLVMGNREKIVLAKAAGQGACSFVVFGAAHDFREEIDAWNREHPDHMFTLVEITPKAVMGWEAR